MFACFLSECFNCSNVLSFTTVVFRVLFCLMGKICNRKREELPFSENFGVCENKICTMTISPLFAKNQ